MLSRLRGGLRNASPPPPLLCRLRGGLRFASPPLPLLSQLREVAVPDIPANGFALREGYLSMCAGDFVEVYGSPVRPKG